MRLSWLSNCTATHAECVVDAWAPLWIRSPIVSPLSSFGLSSPRANFTESRMLDLPDPLGPVTIVSPRFEVNGCLLSERLEASEVDPFDVYQLVHPRHDGCAGFCYFSDYRVTSAAKKVRR